MKRFLNLVADYLRECDKRLFFFSVAASVFGAVIVLSSTYYVLGGLRQFIMHIVGITMGIIAAVILSRFDYHTLTKYWAPICGVILIPVLLTFFVGYAPAGTDDKAWLLIPGINVSVQPAEFLKIGFLLSFSWHLNKVGDGINKLKNIILLCLHGAAPILLIHEQGDDGTALIFAIMFAAMMFTAGLKARYFAIAGGAAVVGAPIIYFFIMNDAQKARISALISPKKEDYLGILWQQSRGRAALANGGLFGKGLFNGPLVQSGSIPEGYNDFIFSSIGEELGMIGCIACIVLITVVALRILTISKLAIDKAGLSICIGTFAMIAGQLIINIGMNLSVMPVIGITLPFFSAGTTSLLTVYIAVGLVMSVFMHRGSGTIYLHDDR